MALRYSAAEMAEARRHDEALLGTTGRFGRSGRLVRRRHLAAVMNAVNTEGREVLSAEADAYWKDQDRRYGLPREPDTAGVTVLRNRFGRVTERTVYTPGGRQALGEATGRHGVHGDFVIQVSGSSTVR